MKEHEIREKDHHNSILNLAWQTVYLRQYEKEREFRIDLLSKAIGYYKEFRKKQDSERKRKSNIEEAKVVKNEKYYINEVICSADNLVKESDGPDNLEYHCECVRLAFDDLYKFKADKKAESESRAKKKASSIIAKRYLGGRS